MKRRSHILSKEEVQQLKAFKKNHTLLETARKFKVATTTVQYHTSLGYKKGAKKRAMKSQSNMNPAQRKAKYKKHYEYTKNYLTNRYHQDPEFRQAILKYIVKNKRKRSAEAIREGLCIHCFKKNDTKFLGCLECRIKRNISQNKCPSRRNKCR